MGTNVGQFVRQWALRDPRRIALVLEDGRHVGFAELDRAASGVAAALAGAGLAPGARVALTGASSLAYVQAWFGTLYAGCTAVPVPASSAAPELRHRLEHARCSALLVDASTRALGEAACAGLALACLDFERLGAREGADDGPRDVPPETLAMVLYTSGTTGVAKGAAITHASLATHTAALVHHALRLEARDVVLGTLPLSHSYGLRMTLLAPFYAGARVVLQSRFAARPALDLAHAHGATWWPVVPTMLSALLALPSPTAPASLRSVTSAGAPLPPSLRERAEETLGVPVRQAYGLTEATISTLATPDDPEGSDTVGRPVFGVEVVVLDENGTHCPPNVDGEVAVRGQNVMAGYLDDPGATHAQLDPRGFLRTGDLGHLDDGGRLVLVDRKKDLVIRGGHNVVPSEVEAVLHAHPDVHEAVVVGVPEAHYGEEVAAVVRLREGRTLDVPSLDAFCRARLGATKVPRLYGATLELPLGASGKVLRRVVRADAIAGVVPLEHVTPAGRSWVVPQTEIENSDTRTS